LLFVIISKQHLLIHQHYIRAKFFILLLVVFTTSCNQARRSDSGLNSDQIIQLSQRLNSGEEEFLTTNLELLGKLWGFLKYHHPEIGKGKYDWDDELFQLLPKYIEISSTEQRDEFLLHWINKYGEIPVCKTCKDTPADAFLKPDFSWLDEIKMSALLKAKVIEIYKNRFLGILYYVRVGSNPNFINDKRYLNEKKPNTSLRLLALYRYWNMVQYFYPYKYLTDTKWDDVLKKYISIFVLAETALDYQLAVLQLLSETNDTHSYLFGQYKIDSLRGGKTAPFSTKFVENKFMVDEFFAPYQKSLTGLHRGDIITHINGKKIDLLQNQLMVMIITPENLLFVPVP